MPRKESLNEEYLDRQVAKVGGFTRKAKWQGHRGAPDRWCGFPRHRRAAWVEVKEEDQPWGLQPHQEREHLRMKACGEEVWVLNNKHEIDCFIKELTCSPS